LAFNCFSFTIYGVLSRWAFKSGLWSWIQYFFTGSSILDIVITKVGVLKQFIDSHFDSSVRALKFKTAYAATFSNSYKAIMMLPGTPERGCITGVLPPAL